MSLPPAIASLRDKTILKLIPGLLRLAEEKGRVQLLLKDEPACRQGEPVTSLMIPLNGTLTLFRKESPQGKEESFGFLQKGRSLCLRQLLSGEPAPYTAIPDSQVMILSIPGDEVRALVQETEGLVEYFDLMTISPGVRSFKQFLSDLDVPFKEIVRIISRVTLNASAFKAGEIARLHGPGLVFIDKGVLLARSNGTSFLPYQAFLSAGQWCGGGSIVPPHVNEYELSVVNDATLRWLRLDGNVKLLDELGITHLIFSDPWIKKNQTAVQTGEQRPLTPLPGELGSDEILQRNYGIDARQLVTCSSDEESAVASVINICRLLRLNPIESNIRAEFGLAKKITFLFMAQILERQGADATSLKTTVAALDKHTLPGIVAIKGRIVILLSINEKQVCFQDPARGVVVLPRWGFEGLWDGMLLEVERSDLDVERASAFKEMDSTAFTEYGNPVRRNTLMVVRSIFKTLRTLNPLLPTVLTIIVLFILTGLVSPLLFGYLIDSTVTLRSTKLIYLLAGGSFLVVVFNSAMIPLQGLVFGLVQERFDRRLHKMLFRHLFLLPHSRYPKDIVGDVFTRFGQLHAVAQFVTQLPVKLGIQGVMTIAFSIALAVTEPKLALPSLVTVPIVAVLRIIYRGRFRRGYELTYEGSKRAQSLITELFTSVQAVKAFGAERTMREKWEVTTVELSRLSRQLHIESSTVEALAGLASTVAQGLSLAMGIAYALEGQLTIGSVMAVNLYASQLHHNLLGIAHDFESFERIKVAMRKIIEVLAAKREDEKSEGGVCQSQPLKGKITMEKVAFRYEKEGPWVLDGIDLTIYPRQRVALVGVSGCGKTTIANIIAGNLQPTGGRLLFDDVDSRQIGLWYRRQQVGFIMQDSMLFRGTLQDNIAYGDDAVDFEEVKQAAVDAGADEFIEKFINGYEYYLSEGGTGLSGGQRQRVSIARILYRNPRILILDEATSNLDTETEMNLVKRLNAYLDGKTAIIIAHRLSTVRNADRTIVLKEGRVVGDGTHDELIHSCPHYAELFYSQIEAGVVS